LKLTTERHKASCSLSANSRASYLLCIELLTTTVSKGRRFTVAKYWRFLCDAVDGEFSTVLRARYTLATKLSSTHSTLLKVDCCQNRQKSATKSTVAVYVRLCCRYVHLCCQFWQQIMNNVNSTACHGRLCC